MPVKGRKKQVSLRPNADYPEIQSAFAVGLLCPKRNKLAPGSRVFCNVSGSRVGRLVLGFPRFIAGLTNEIPFFLGSEVEYLRGTKISITAFKQIPFGRIGLIPVCKGKILNLFATLTDAFGLRLGTILAANRTEQVPSPLVENHRGVFD